ASGWTRDAATARRLQQELQAGVVTINDCVSSYGEPTAPWGGFKHSGIGRTHGAAGLREMAQVKYVSEDRSARPALWWSPDDAEAAGGSCSARIVLQTATQASQMNTRGPAISRCTWRSGFPQKEHASGFFMGCSCSADTNPGAPSSPRATGRRPG